MRDPVTLVQSAQTYDRELLCQSLASQNAHQMPSYKQDYREKLQYIENIIVRQLMVMHMGGAAFQKLESCHIGRKVG